MSDIAIRVENLSKQFRIGMAKHSYYTLRDQLVDSMKSILRGDWRPHSRKDMIWALKDVSFEVKHGEVVGIIGRNGSGKSTLLKILSRITEPTKGRAELYGRVGSLLEVGTGFHPELTGRENIYLNGAILGMKKTEIEQKFDEIVSFSGIERFVDTPVKRYSSGMYVRLAFSVMAHLECDVLLVDEVLAVGDVSFQNKCLNKMDSAARGGKTILFVSHNLGAIERICNRVILLEEGLKIADGGVSQITRKYLENQFVETSSTISLNDHPGRPKGSEMILREARLYTNGQETNIIRAGDSMKIEVSFKCDKPMAEVHFGIAVNNAAGKRMTAFHSYLQAPYLIPDKVSEGKILCEIPHLHLMPGLYHLTFSLHTWGPTIVELDRINQALPFRVQDVDVFGWGRPIESGMDMGAFFEEAKWEFEEK